MKKLLCWLLLLLLPLMGMFVAQGLMPARKPSWNNNIESHFIDVLGFVEDGQTLLVRELLSPGPEYLMALDTGTGKARFRIPLAFEILQSKPGFTPGFIRQAKLTADGKHIVLSVMSAFLPYNAPGAAKPDSREQDAVYDNVPRHYVVIYDWKQQKVSKVIQTPDGIVSEVSSTGDYLVYTHNHLHLYNINQPECLKTVPLTVPSNQVQLSPLSGIVSFEDTKGFLRQLELFDIQSNKLLPAISAWLHDIKWAEDEQAFTCIGLDTIKNSLAKYRFIRQGDQFVVDSSQDHLFHVTGNVLPDQHFTAIATTVKEYPWRTKMDREIGGLATALMDRLWPNAQVLLLYDRLSSELKHKLTLPIGHKALTSFKLNTHPSGNSLALWDGHYIQYWDLYPVSRWYPLVGLLVGTLLACVVGWKVLKVRAKKPVSGTP